MKALRIHFTAAVCALALAAVSSTSSCSQPPPAPEAFTAQLEEIEGAMVFASLQHPKLVIQGLNRLIADVPEASYARIMLESSLDQFGYPEFSEIAAGSNIGLIMPSVPFEQFLEGGSLPVLFIKLKPDGKIWNALTDMAGLSVRQHGEWAMFAPMPGALAAVKNPDAVIARLEKPQAEHLRVWAGGFSAETIASCKSLLNDAISHAINKGSLPDAEKTAFTAYIRLLFDEIFDSVHSAHVSIHLGDTGLQLAYGGQYKPDTPIGTLLRYRSEATPAAAQYIANDALITASTRFVPKAAQDYIEHLTGLLLKVDYPPLSVPLAKLMQDSADYWKQTDGCSAITMDMEMDFENPLVPKISSDTFVVDSGKFDQKGLKYTTASVEFAQQFMSHLMNVAGQSGGPNLPGFSITSKPESLKIEGTSFDEITIAFTGLPDDMPAPPAQTYYFGIAAGNLVLGTSESVLQKRLPVFLAKKPLPNSVAAANPLQPHDILSMSLNGGALVDLVCKTMKIDLADADRKAAFDSVKDTYNQTTPARCIVQVRQAGGSYKVDIPYKFIAASAKLGQYAYTATK